MDTQSCVLSIPRGCAFVVVEHTDHPLHALAHPIPAQGRHQRRLRHRSLGRLSYTSDCERGHWHGYERGASPRGQQCPLRERNGAAAARRQAFCLWRQAAGPGGARRDGRRFGAAGVTHPCSALTPCTRTSRPGPSTKLCAMGPCSCAPALLDVTPSALLMPHAAWPEP